MAEFIIGASLLGLGLLCNKKKEKKQSNNNISLNEAPSGKNIYESTYSNYTQQQESKFVNNNYQKSKDPINTNIIPENMNQRIVNNQTQPLNFSVNQSVRAGNEHFQSKENEISCFDFNDTYFNNQNIHHDLPSGTDIKQSQCGEDYFKSNLTGTTIENFKHNNMIPFFGGSVKQNMDVNKNQATLDLFTGNFTYDKPKQESAPMFQPEQDLGNIYGNPVSIDEELQYYTPSQRRNNEFPIPSINVGPGLNQGYTAEPSGGFAQNSTRDYVMPKTVDELRAKTNPKLTYEGRVLSGKGINQNRTAIPNVQKYRPETSFELGSERWFTTKGAVTGNTQRPEQIIRNTKRKVSRPLTGIAGPTNKAREQRITVTPDPTSADADDDFGFTTTVDFFEDSKKYNVTTDSDE